MRKQMLNICVGLMTMNLVLVLGGCQTENTKNDEARQQTESRQAAEKTEEDNEEDKADDREIEYVMTAVYLTNKEGTELFVELATDMPFYSTVPEGELYDEEGNKITKADLKNGDVLEITGNGSIEESYPAQYHSVTKMQRTEKENQEYVKKYQEILEQVTVRVDAKELPYLDVNYRMPEAIIRVMVNWTGGYTWSYPTENGETETITVDSEHILQHEWTENDVLAMDAGTVLELSFNVKPKEVKVTRWQFSKLSEKVEIKDAAELPEGELVEVTENTEGNPQITAEPESIYLIEATWENGEAQYGFCTTQALRE